MTNNKKAYRKLIILRNKHLLNQIDTLEFLKGVEKVLFNYVGVNSVKMAGGNGLYAYSTIAIRLLSDPLGKNHYLRNLKIDLTY